MNKIVASYDPLHYCQCDIGRKQKQKQTNRTTYLMQAADLRAKTRKTAKTSGWSYICSTRSVSVKTRKQTEE